MRVIAGSARRLLLSVPEGKDTRPTTDRIKETLFNILQFDLVDQDILDLFAGSGALGIEALSRGAKRAVFCDSGKKALACIEQNIARCHFQEQALVYGGDFHSALRSLEGKDYHFGIVFLDPPYGEDLAKEALRRLVKSSMVGKDTVFVVEAALEEDFSELEEEGYQILREKLYKTNKHIFLRLQEAV